MNIQLLKSLKISVSQIKKILTSKERRINSINLDFYHMKKPPLNISVKKGLAIILVFFGLPIFYCIMWLMLSEWSFHQINKILIETVSQQRISAPLQLTRSGFPFSISWHAERVKAATSLLDGELSLQFSDIMFRTPLFDPTTLNIRAGRATLTSINRQKQISWVFQSNALNITINSAVFGKPRLLFKLENVELLQQEEATPILDWQNHFVASKIVITLNQTLQPESPTQKSALDVSVDLKGINLNSSPVDYFNDIKNAYLGMNIIGFLDASNVSSVVDWRDDGGTIEINKLRVDASPIILEMRGTLSLDQELKPIGSGTVLVYGAKEFIEGKVGTRDISRTEGLMIQLALSLLPTKMNRDGKLSIQIPITAQKGKLQLGPFMITELFSIVG